MENDIPNERGDLVHFSSGNLSISMFQLGLILIISQNLMLRHSLQQKSIKRQIGISIIGQK